MNQIHKTLAVFSLAAILGGNVTPVTAQNISATTVAQTSAEEFFNQGLKKMQQEDFQGAIKDFNESIKINTKNPEAFYFRGLAFDLLEQNDKAIEDYSQAIILAPDNTFAYNNRGTVYAELKNYQKAIDDYNQALKIDGQNANAYYNRGLANAALAKPKDATADFEKAAEIYKKEGKVADYQDCLDRIKELQNPAPPVAPN